MDDAILIHPDGDAIAFDGDRILRTDCPGECCGDDPPPDTCCCGFNTAVTTDYFVDRISDLSVFTRTNRAQYARDLLWRLTSTGTCSARSFQTRRTTSDPVYFDEEQEDAGQASWTQQGTMTHLGGDPACSFPANQISNCGDVLRVSGVVSVSALSRLVGQHGLDEDVFPPRPIIWSDCESFSGSQNHSAPFSASVGAEPFAGDQLRSMPVGAAATGPISGVTRGDLSLPAGSKAYDTYAWSRGKNQWNFQIRADRCSGPNQNETVIVRPKSPSNWNEPAAVTEIVTNIVSDTRLRTAVSQSQSGSFSGEVVGLFYQDDQQLDVEFSGSLNGETVWELTEDNGSCTSVDAGAASASATAGGGGESGGALMAMMRGARANADRRGDTGAVGRLTSLIDSVRPERMVLPWSRVRGARGV